MVSEPVIDLSIRLLAALAAVTMSGVGHASQAEGSGGISPRFSVQHAFTPGDRADQLIIDTISSAQKEILVQAFSFTHRRIAAALIKSRSRGVDVVVIADREQTRHLETSVVPNLAEARVPVFLDGHHSAAHNKVMVVDAESADCAVVTGSFNFTHAAQSANAENVLVLRSSPELCSAFRRNWHRHKSHAIPYRQ